MIPEFLENDRLRLFEYEMRRSASDSYIDYTSVLNGVFDKIRCAEGEGPLSILKLDEIPSHALLQNVEDGIIRRISEYLEFDEPIDECINGDRRIPQPYWNSLERKLNEKIDTVRPIGVAEQVIKADEILDQGKAEAVEEALFAKIREYENEHSAAPARLVPFYRFAKALPIAASLIIGASLMAGYFVYHDSFNALPSVVYQAQGKNLGTYKKVIPSTGVVQSEKGGSLTLVNTKGYIELRNGSKLEIVKASKREVLYRTRFAGADNQLVGQGSATFFVNHQKKNEKYVVATHDYRIEVTGTYFRLQPDINGHVSVAVREGEVKITFNTGETKFLKAGQMLAYDLNSNTFTTINDGITVSRQEIEQLPDIKDLDDYQRISVNSNPSAGVRIDGNYIGMTPLIIMQSRGLHSVRVEKNGYRTIDTAVMIGAGDSGVCTFTLAEMRSADSEVPNSPPVYEDEKVAPRLKSDPKPPEGKLEASAQSVSSSSYSDKDFRDAELLESNNWREALELYRKVFENPHTSKLKKETALFSVAKLEAEHGQDKKSAREAFLRYLALYPTGNFVGESWLRLAELEFEHNQNKAIDYYQKYFERFPRHSRISELQYRVGLIYLQSKKFDEAISMFKVSLANYQGSDAIEKDKIKTSLFKALKEKNESTTALPANASGMAP